MLNFYPVMSRFDVITREKMQSSEKLCLKWIDFQENLNSAFGRFRSDQDFADVTLVCEDGTQIETHKMILASSSPFFMEILKKNKHPHPMIYMRGLRSDHMVAMVDFLYFGEANVDQERLDAFLGLAAELKLKGLRVAGEHNKQKQEAKPPPTEMKFEQKIEQEDLTSNVLRPLSNEYNTEAKLAPSSNSLASVEAGKMDEKFKSLMTHKPLTHTLTGSQRLSAWVCNVCGKEDLNKSNIKTHIEAIHITSGLSYPCDVCGRASRTKQALRMHKSRSH